MGRLRFDDGAAKALDAAGANTDGTFAKLNVQASRTTALPAQLALTTSVRARLARPLPMAGPVQLSASGFADYGWSRAARPLAARAATN